MTTNLSHAASLSLTERAHNIRRHALRMGQVQGQGYVGQALGAADLLAVSYFHAMNHRPTDPEWEQRDRFYLSIGHYAIALYAALIEAEIIPLDELETYGSDDSRLPMSGMASYTPGMEMSGGSLGQGLPIAVGMALALRHKGPFLKKPGLRTSRWCATCKKALAPRKGPLQTDASARGQGVCRSAQMSSSRA